MSLPEEIKKLTVKVEGLEREISNLKAENQEKIEKLRVDSIQTLRDLPGNIASIESKMLDKQNRSLSVAITKHDSILSLALHKQNRGLTIFTIIFAILTFSIGSYFNSIISSQVSDFNQKSKDVKDLLESLRSSPDSAYQRLKEEEVSSALKYLKDQPSEIAKVFYLIDNASNAQLPSDTFKTFREFVINREYDKDSRLYSRLILEKFSFQIVTSNSPDLIEALLNVSLPQFKDDASEKIIKNLSRYVKYDSSRELIKGFLNSLLRESFLG